MLSVDHVVTIASCDTNALGGTLAADNGLGIQVDVSTSFDLDIVASDLREAMEVALE